MFSECLGSLTDNVVSKERQQPQHYKYVMVQIEDQKQNGQTAISSESSRGSCLHAGNKFEWT